MTSGFKKRAGRRQFLASPIFDAMGGVTRAGDSAAGASAAGGVVGAWAGGQPDGDRGDEADDSELGRAQSGGAPDGYIVHLKPADGTKGKIKRSKANELPANKTSVVFSGLAAGATCEIRVRTVNNEGKGQSVRATATQPTA